MLCFIVLAMFFASVCAEPMHDKPFYHEEFFAQYFVGFMSSYHKYYFKINMSEYYKRYDIFKENLATINELNAKDDHAIYDINEYADSTDAEVGVSYTPVDKTNKTISCSKKHKSDFRHDDDSDSFDWRKEGVVTEVKDRMDCHAGWAFAHVEAVEGQYAKKHKSLIEFSTQQVIDCVKEYNGCKRGDSLSACCYLGKDGFMKEADYNYVGSQGKCSYDKNKVFGRYDSCVIIDLKEESVTKALKYYGPLAAKIDSKNVRFYKSGIITECAFKGYNNALLMTGYGTENGIPYWSFKNSRGEGWGEEGYVRIKRGVSCLGVAGKYTLTTGNM